MKFYSIWAKLFNFGLKNTKKKKKALKIYMGPRKEITMINIHKITLKLKFQ